jgi:hypothetical protein
MKKPVNPSVKILHVDQEYQITYRIFGEGTKAKSKISIPQAIELVHTVPLDLILSEPQDPAILSSPLKVEAAPDLEIVGTP